MKTETVVPTLAENSELVLLITKTKLTKLLAYKWGTGVTEIVVVVITKTAILVVTGILAYLLLKYLADTINVAIKNSKNSQITNGNGETPPPQKKNKNKEIIPKEILIPEYEN